MANTTASIQAYLDSLSQLPGSLLYRDTLDWTALPPGNEGEILSISDQLKPQWKALQTYWPAAIQYTAAANYYTKTNFTISNSDWTLVLRFSHPAVAAYKPILQLRSGTNNVLWVYIANPGYLRVEGRNVAAALYLNLSSLLTYVDGEQHIMFLSYEKATGNFTWKVDGIDANNAAFSGYTHNAATLTANSTTTFWVSRTIGGGDWWSGTISYHGLRYASGILWSDFMTPAGHPKPIDYTTWTQWLAQPSVWHESGQLENNRGSAGAFTKTGTLWIADPLLWS